MVCGPSPLLPIVKDPDGKQHDPLFTARVETAVAKAQELTFPANFIFGSATSSYQVEGGIVDTNWNRWEAQKTRKDGGETVKNGEGAGAACDMWNLFESVDLPLIKQLGLGSFRFSIEWSRVEPTEGNFDEAAMARYVSWCRGLREADIEPCVTLLHFTEPGWFVDKGGWEKRANVPCFVRFCKYVIDHLAPHCSMWCTLNEPVGTTLNGWLQARRTRPPPSAHGRKGQAAPFRSHQLPPPPPRHRLAVPRRAQGIHPPGKTGEVRLIFRVLYNQLMAHKQARPPVAKHAPAR